MIKRALAIGVSSFFVAALVATAASVAPTASSATPSGAFGLPFGGTSEQVCPTASAGHASCLAINLEHEGEQVYNSNFTRPARGNNNTTISGLSPSQLEGVYGFSGSSTAGTGQTIALVDAYNDPTAAPDLATFSTQYGLPACTTTNGCFSEVNESGGTSLPTTNDNWALEISLDIEWAHAIAPGADILLVEANSNSDSDLYTAEQYAGAHANYVSNSWGGSEYSGETADDSYFTSTSGNVSFFAATGDSGGEVDYPATSPNVVAVGGTSLSFTSSGAFSSESAWSDGGGGCSTYEAAVASQAAVDKATGCTKRSVPDVSLDADPNSGVAVYDSTSYEGESGWWTVGGTSVATPVWAAQSADQGIHLTPSSVYTSGLSFRDITSGSNGHPTLVGYDEATGMGSWALNAPKTPSNLTATGGSGSISLSWTAASGATSYDIYRGTSSGGESTTPIATGVTGTTYQDSTVSGSTTYYYEVAGVDSAGAGDPSNEASAAPSGSSSGGTPSAPTGLSATASSGKVALSWTGSSGATSYQVLRGTASGKESSTPIATGITGTTYSDTSVSAGSTYYYEVEAVNGSNVSGPSNEASATVPSSGGGGGSSTPTASFTTSCSLATCTFSSTSTDTGGTITTYSWSGGNGLSGSTSKIEHSYSQAGNYSVTLSVTDSNSHTATATGSVICVAYFGSLVVCQ